MSTVELRGVSKVLGGDGHEVHAVDRADLFIGDGEFFVFIGPSGCGKTTLLRMIAGIERPTTGQVMIDGVVVNQVDAHRRGVAMTFQSSALYPNLTVAENIGFPLRLAKEKRAVIDRRIQEVARLVSVDHLLMRWPRQLSGGEGQRVAMARMLIRSPSLFLMDEPMSQLDAKLRTELRTGCGASVDATRSGPGCIGRRSLRRCGRPRWPRGRGGTEARGLPRRRDRTAHGQSTIQRDARLAPAHALHSWASAVCAVDEGLVAADDHDAPLVVALDPSVSFDVWRPLHLGIDTAQLHLFDAVDGSSLERPLGAYDSWVRPPSTTKISPVT